MSRKPKRLAGYCLLCRQKEIELYGTVLNDSGPRHIKACLAAGCLHPAFYELPPDADQHNSWTTEKTMCKETNELAKKVIRMAMILLEDRRDRLSLLQDAIATANSYVNEESEESCDVQCEVGIHDWEMEELAEELIGTPLNEGPKLCIFWDLIDMDRDEWQKLTRKNATDWEFSMFQDVLHHIDYDAFTNTEGVPVHITLSPAKLAESGPENASAALRSIAKRAARSFMDSTRHR